MPFDPLTELHGQEIRASRGRGRTLAARADPSVAFRVHRRKDGNLALDDGDPGAGDRDGAELDGGSFVRLYSTLDTGRLDEIRAVVEHGLFRSAATRESEHH